MSIDPQHLIARAQVIQQVRSCVSCDLCKVGSGPIPLRGPTPPSTCDIAILGEAPGREEDIQGRPFVGPSGKLVEEWLASVGIDSNAVGFLNTVSCYPNRTPTGKEVEACKGNLRSQLSLIRPRYILVLGGVAVSAFWPGIRMGDIRGLWWQITGEWGKAWALATWHPAAVLRNGKLQKDVDADIRSFRFTSVTSRDQRHPVLGPFNVYCIVCGAFADVWESSPGITSATGEGIAWCQKHWDTKQGIKGRGKVVGKIVQPRQSRKKEKVVKPNQDAFL